jgi:hypothetical protein
MALDDPTQPLTVNPLLQRQGERIRQLREGQPRAWSPQSSAGMPLTEARLGPAAALAAALGLGGVGVLASGPIIRKLQARPGQLLKQEAQAEGREEETK